MLQAGEAILGIREKGASSVSKQDGSPVTEADKLAEEITLAALKVLEPQIPIVSEENAASHETTGHGTFFLVDPLDGTREFLKQDGEAAFTVNIALISDGSPVMGLIHAPAQNRMFSGIAGSGAFEHSRSSKQKLSIRARDISTMTAVASVSHRDEQTDLWLRDKDITNVVSIGSSLKFCLIAAGEADVYPRFGPTMEWDTAAGDAILRAAGGSVVHLDGLPFSYGKPGYKNGPFIAGGFVDLFGFL